MDAEPTADHVADDEWLTRLFERDDWQEGKISSAAFKSELVSVFRDRYLRVNSVIEEHSKDCGAAQITAGFVRADPRHDLEVIKDEPPYAHAHIQTSSGKRNTTGQARRLRDQAMMKIAKLPQGLE